MGGVVPGVVLGVVPVVVLGVVPGVVEGVVPGVVVGVVPVVVVGMAAGVLGGQSALVLDGVVDDAPGIVELGLVDDGLAVLMVEELELAEGLVDVTGQFCVPKVVEGDWGDVVAEPGLVACVPEVVELDCVPGTTGVGVIAPFWGACAMAIPTAKHNTNAINIARVLIDLSCWIS